MTSRTTTVLLDLDDTLFDHTHSAHQGIAALRAGFAPLARVGFAELAKIHARNLEAIHTLLLAGEISVDEARIARFRAIATDCGAPSLDPLELLDVYRQAYQGARRPVPGALELLAGLRERAKVAIVTNNVVREQLEKLALLGMSQLVDVLVISEDVGVRKPDPRIFRLALERCAGAAESAVMLGDSWGSDILGARSASIRAVWLNREGRPCPAPSHCAEIRSLLPTESVLELLVGS